MLSALSLFAAMAAAAADATPAPNAAAAACAHPNVAARTVRAAQPDFPWSLARYGVGGTVTVKVTLGQDSRVQSVGIMRSPSALLNGPALDAARRSTFQTEVRDCVPLSQTFAFAVYFDNPIEPPRFSDDSTPRTLTVTGEGVCTEWLRNAEATAAERAIADAESFARALAARRGMMVTRLLSKSAKLSTANGQVEALVRATYALEQDPSASAPPPKP